MCIGERDWWFEGVGIKTQHKTFARYEKRRRARDRRPLESVAALLANPGNMTKWMDDLERVEPLNGEPGMPGSTFRMVGKAGGPQSDFVVTVTGRILPKTLRLKLQSPSVDVAIADTLTTLSARKTKLVSEEWFRFHGLFNTLFGFLAQSKIRKHHRRHMESFKRFAEDTLQSTTPAQTRNWATR